MTTAAIYCRISRDRRKEAANVASRERACRALATRLGWEVVDVLIDNDLSAYSGKPRPGYARLMDGLSDGTYTGVVAWHPDRLHRRPVELEEFIAVVEDVGAAVATVPPPTAELGSCEPGVRRAKPLRARAESGMTQSAWVRDGPAAVQPVCYGQNQPWVSTRLSATSAASRISPAAGGHGIDGEAVAPKRFPPNIIDIGA